MSKTWYLIQQSRNFFLIESEGPPDLKVPDGEKRKVLRAGFAHKSTAEEQGAVLAAAEMGTFQAK